MATDTFLKHQRRFWPEHDRYKNSKGEWFIESQRSFNPQDFPNNLTPPALETLAVLHWAGGSITGPFNGSAGLTLLCELNLSEKYRPDRNWTNEVTRLTGKGMKLAKQILQNDLFGEAA